MKDDFKFLHSKCHTESPTWMKIYKDGKIELICASCEKIIIPDISKFMAMRPRRIK